MSDLKQQLKELVEGTLIIGAKRGSDKMIDTDTAKCRVKQHIDSVYSRFESIINQYSAMTKNASNSLIAVAQQRESLKQQLKTCNETCDGLCDVLDQLQSERDKLREALESATERMERARGILNREDGNSNWGMLDTSDLTQALNP